MNRPLKDLKNKVSKRVLNAIYKSLEDADESLNLLKSEDLAAYRRVIAGLIRKDTIQTVNYEDD